jgi:hypothetical protein
MRRIIRHRPSPAMAVAFIALLVALADVAVASIPGPGPGRVIKACYSKRTGGLRVIDSKKSCSAKRERTLRWNQQGKQGSPGVQGPSGATNIVLHQGAFATGNAVIQCPSGERAVGGGGLVGTNTNHLIQSAPVDSGGVPTNGATSTGWLAAAADSTGATALVSPFVVCASP